MATYSVLVMDPENGTEEIRQYEATALGEALQMAEQEDAGVRSRIYGVQVADFDLARAEGIEFNEADGLLL